MKKFLVIFVVMAIVIGVTALVAPVKAAHYEKVWVQDQPGYWDSVPVELPDGRIRYKAKWMPPSGHYESVLVNDPVFIVPVVPTYVVPVYVAPAPYYYGYGGRHYRR